MKEVQHLLVKVLVVDDIHPVFMTMLNADKFTVDYRPEITYKETLDIISDYEVLIVRSKFRVERELLERASKLRLIGRAGAGIDNINGVLATAFGITLVSANEGNCDAVAEHMLGMLLVLLHRISSGDFQVRGQIWDREGHRGVELGGKTVGLIGYGNNGKAMAKKLSGFGVSVLAYDKYLLDYSDSYVRESSIDEIQKKADVVSLHIPLTEETKGWIDASFFSRLSRPIYFLNGARGEIVEITALIEAIKSGKVRGAALDVLQVEGFPALSNQTWYTELSNMDQVLLTPHVAGWSVESYQKIAFFLAEKVLAFYS